MAWRFYWVLFLIVLAAVGLTWRIFELTVLNQHFLRKQGDERVIRLVNTPAFRGMMVDRNGFPLAVSTLVYSVWMNPQEFIVSDEDLSDLSRLLNIKSSEITFMVHRYQKQKREFVYLKRALSPEVANQIKLLAIPGVYLQKEYHRYYPEGEVTAHVVGFTNVDDRGQEGLELSYNEWLAGEPGKKWVIKDRLGREIADVQNVNEQKPGHDLVLSIDRRIQYLAYRELLNGVAQSQARSGSVIVLDAKTGEILAMVNQPSFNPNNRPARMSDRLRNRAVTDLFEPGSVIKAFTEASALETGFYKPDSFINTSPGWMRVGHHVVKDEKNNGVLSMAQILQISSNMGAAKIALSLPPDQLWSLLHRVGFGEALNIGFPGEQNGVLVKQPAGSFPLATLSFGYGLSVTALQLAHAYAVLANNGMKVPLSILRLDHPPVGERVMDAKTVQQMLLLLEAVTFKGGTAHAASVPGYRVAGKTGTAWLMGAKGYQKNRFNSSFVGIAPVSDPRLIIVVVLHDPQGKQHQGGEISAPVFERIMEGSLRILNVPPDGVLQTVG
ncbi:MAG: penicillin-binding protein 2 [Gammaproteobacteria bacterium]|nr:MAG: penicillin-binding protein 2 [Gammaproteobacteria bacterium]